MTTQSEEQHTDMTRQYDGDVCLEGRVRELEIRAAVLEKVNHERAEILKLTASALESRLELLNELRTDVLTRGEYTKSHEGLIFRIELVEKMQSRFVGVAIALVAMAGAAGAVLSHLLK
jgi:hypothetical protein